MNDVRTAILKAADHISAFPSDFDFRSADVPVECGMPGCALGWIGYFAGRPDAIGNLRYSFGTVAVHVLELPHEGDVYFGHEAAQTFYDRMTEFEPHWSHLAGACAYALRKYADKYHPADGNQKVSWEDCVWKPNKVSA